MEVVEKSQTRESREVRIEIPDEHSGQGKYERKKSLLDPRDYQPLCHKIFLFCCVVAASLDPLFFYIPVINDHKKCLEIDEKLKNTVLVLRSLMDLTYIFHIAYQIYSGYLAPPSESNGSLPKSETIIDRIMGVIRRINSRMIIVNVMCVLPIPQVVILVYFPKMKGSESLNWRKFLNFIILLQFLPRIFRIYHSGKELTKNVGPSEIARAAWVKGLFNFFLYVIASHLFGAMWYLFSVQRESACWQHACKGNSTCNQSTFFCMHRKDIANDPITGYLKHSCNLETPLLFDFGIFTPALKSRVVNSMDFPRKFFYCFSWGLRNLSSFGSNLETSTYFWESLFSAAITVIGLLLFIYLIGNLQTYLQFSAADSEDSRRKKEKKEGEFEKWMESKDFPSDFKKELKESVAPHLHENEDVNLKTVMEVIRTKGNTNLERRVFDHIFNKKGVARVGYDRPKRVTKRENQSADAIYDYLTPKLYTENECILRKGVALDKIIMVIKGQMKTSLCGDRHCDVNYVNKGQFYGTDLLLEWALSTPLESECNIFPVSREEVIACTKVEAFVLRANDLRNLLRQYLLQTHKELKHSPENMEKWASSAINILRVAMRRHIRNSDKRLNQSDKEGQVLEIET